MTEPPTQNLPTLDKSQDKELAGTNSSWPWWIKVGVAIALAALWIVLFAKPALGVWRFWR